MSNEAGHPFYGNQWTHEQQAEADKNASELSQEHAKFATSLSPGMTMKHGDVEISRRDQNYHGSEDVHPETENMFDVKKGEHTFALHRQDLEKRAAKADPGTPGENYQHTQREYAKTYASAADNLSHKAEGDSERAEKTGRMSHHDFASRTHEQAANAHFQAASYFAKGGDMTRYNAHAAEGSAHLAKSQAHLRKADEAGERIKGGLSSRWSYKMDSPELQASLKGAGFSLTDMQSKIAELCQEDHDMCLVCDILAPAEESGETWKAIVSCDGDLYAVSFKVGDGSDLELVGEPNKVERTTDYELAPDSEEEGEDDDEALEGKSALQASSEEGHPFYGNQYTKDAKGVSAAAAGATEKADKSGSVADHQAAAAAHGAAYDAHKKAYQEYDDKYRYSTSASGDAQSGRRMITYHANQMSKEHEAQQVHEAKAEGKEPPLTGKARDKMRSDAGDTGQKAMYHYGGNPQMATEKQHEEAAKLHEEAAEKFHKAGSYDMEKVHQGHAERERKLADFKRTHPNFGKDLQDFAGLAKGGPMQIKTRSAGAKAGELEASNEPGHPFYGNQYTEAKEASEEAHHASEEAAKSGKPEDHEHAAAGHKYARDAHQEAAQEAMTSEPENKHLVAYHRSMAEAHEHMADMHEKAANPTPVKTAHEKAGEASERAEKASTFAKETTNIGKYSAHKLAAESHHEAGQEHEKAAGLAREANDEKSADEHYTKAGEHFGKEKYHQMRADKSAGAPKETFEGAKKPRWGQTEKSTEAFEKAGKAERASKAAEGTASHFRAAFEHQQAGDAHREAARDALHRGEPELAKRHNAEAEYHENKAQEHQRAATPEPKNSYDDLKRIADSKADEAYRAGRNANDSGRAGLHDHAAKLHDEAAEAQHKAGAEAPPKDYITHHNAALKHRMKADSHRERAAFLRGGAQASGKVAGDNGLEAGEFRGNQHKGPAELAAEYGAAARVASAKARKATKDSKDGDKGSHDLAASAHNAAADAHTEAAMKCKSAGMDEECGEHEDLADAHKKKAAEHVAALQACQMRSGEKPEGQLDAKALGDALECASRAEASDVRSLVRVDALKDGTLMYMPAGRHVITPSCNGEPVKVVVEIDAAAAEAIESQRAKLEAAGKKPFFSILHESEISGFWPTKFYWDTKLDATGAMATGVWADGSFTKAGTEAVEGKNLRTFSPTFFTDAAILRKDPKDSDSELVAKYRGGKDYAKIVCNEHARPNMGALENDPAFQEISPLWARGPGGKGIDLCKTAKFINRELAASGMNPSLCDIRSELFKRTGHALSEYEIGEFIGRPD